MSRPESELIRSRLARVMIYTALALSPVRFPFPRLDPSPPPAAVLPVGDPTPGIGFRPVS